MYPNLQRSCGFCDDIAKNQICKIIYPRDRMLFCRCTKINQTYRKLNISWVIESVKHINIGKQYTCKSRYNDIIKGSFELE